MTEMTREELMKVIGEAVGSLEQEYDREQIIAYLAEFLAEAIGKPPKFILPEAEAAAASFVILEDVARFHPLLTGSKVMHGGDIGVPKKIAEIFTWGLFLGVFLSAKGAAQWPTKTLNS
jgi:hypothetical protein